MASLSDIQKQVQATKPAAPVAQTQVVARERGDDLMGKAQAINNFNDEEKRFIQRFAQSKQIVNQKMQENPGYAEATMGGLQDLHGEALAHKLIDEADNIKIEFMKEKQPQLFNSGAAATAGFLNEASFGQLSKIMGKAGELINGTPYEQVVEAKAEELRLLQKAFPKSDFVGKAASYLIPGSPAKMLFTKVAGLGGKVAGGLISRIVQNPGLLSKAIQTGAAAGSGAAAVAGTAGTVGQDNQEVSFDRGMENALSAGATGAMFGFATPIGARAVSTATKAVAPVVKEIARSVRDTTGSVVEQLSGTPTKALRAFNTRGPEIRRAAGTESDIGRDLVDHLQSSRSQLPEVAQANQLLPNLPNVDAKPVINYLRSIKPGIDPSLDPKVKMLGEWADRIEQSLPNGAKDGVPATKMREVVDQMQDSLREQFGQESPFLAEHLKQASRMARESIVNTAKTHGGEAGQTYVKLMEKAADKRGVLEFIGKQLGGTPEIQEMKSEGFIKNLFGPNKEVVRARMSDLDRQFGTNFLELAENASLAKQLGKNGKPSWFSNLGTGKAALGTVTGLATGGTAGAAAGAVFSSPRAGAMLLGASDKITGFVRRMVANPDALSRLGKSGATPIEIRRLAREVENALTKDGPISAGSMTRVIADTPYFIGLVHAFEKADRESQQRTGESALGKFQGQQQNQEIATPSQQ